jgi:hypothetical protein
MCHKDMDEKIIQIFLKNYKKMSERLLLLTPVLSGPLRVQGGDML